MDQTRYKGTEEVPNVFSPHRKALSLTTVFAVVSLLTLGALAIGDAAGDVASAHVVTTNAVAGTATDHPCLPRYAARLRRPADKGNDETGIRLIRVP